MEIPSYEIGTVFYRLSRRTDLNKGFILVEKCFEKYPKDFDSITRIILQGLLESTYVLKEKLFFGVLIQYLEHLYLEFLKNQA